MLMLHITHRFLCNGVAIDVGRDIFTVETHVHMAVIKKHVILANHFCLLVV